MDGIGSRWAGRLRFLPSKQEQPPARDRGVVLDRDTLARIAPGVTTYREVLDSVPLVPQKYRPLLDNYHIFHGIGMSYAESPRVDRKLTKLDVPLQPNQIVSIESYFGEQGSPLAVKLEEMVLVRDGAAEVLGAGIPYDDRFID